MRVKLKDDGKKKHQSVSASLPDLWVEPYGYGQNEMEALSDLLVRLDQVEADVRTARENVRAMLDERSNQLSSSPS